MRTRSARYAIDDIRRMDEPDLAEVPGLLAMRAGLGTLAQCPKPATPRALRAKDYVAYLYPEIRAKRLQGWPWGRICEAINEHPAVVAARAKDPTIPVLSGGYAGSIFAALDAVYCGESGDTPVPRPKPRRSSPKRVEERAA